MMINKKQMWSDNPFDQWTEEELLCMKYQGICYGKGGGSAPPPPPATQTVRQSSEFPEELKPFVSDIFSKAQAVQEQRQEEGFRPELTQQLASFTPDQQAAFTGIREQVGQTRPLFEEATNLARGATRAATDPAEVAALMNPFLRNVTDIEKREAQRVADVQEQQLAAQAAQAGAFGGSRAAVLEAERQRNLAQQLGDIEARGRAAAFQDAQARLQNQFAREGAGAAQLSALGAAIPAQTFKELGALSGIGAAEQQQTQRALDIATQQAREEYGFPMQTLQDFQSILRGFPLPATTNVSRQTFSPAQPLSTQLLGLGTGLAGLAGAAGAFKKAGGLVGAPVAMKDGGYVKLAGGGGLGQLMQGKVQRYQKGGGFSDRRLEMDTTTLEEYIQRLDPESRKAVMGLIYEKTRYLENQPKEVKSQAQEALLKGPASDVIPTPPTRRVSGDIATESIQTAGLRPIDMVEGPGGPPSFVPNNLSFVQKAFGLADDIVMGRGPAQPVTVPLEPKMGVKVPQEQAQTVTTNLNLPQLLSGQTLDPGGADALPQSSLRQSIQERFPFRTGAPTTQYTPPPPAPPIPSAELRSTAPTGDFSPAEGYTKRGQKALEKYNVPSERRGVRPELGDMPVQTEKLGFSTETTEDVRSFLGGTPEARNPFQRFLSTIGADRGITEGLDFFATGADAAGKAVGSLAGIGEYFTTPNFQSVPDAAVLAEREKLIAEGKKDSTPADIGDPDAGPKPSMFPDDPGATSRQELEKAQAAAQKDADAVRENIKEEGSKAPAASPKAPAAGPLTSEEPKNPAEVAAAQKSYDQQIADIKNKDYAADIKDMIGNAPTYEKGEEPDFAARKWLALANFGAGILASGGGKTLAQSIGEAAKPALKELVDIGKEERKIKKELRQERNAQKRADYQDDLQRFNLQRQLRSDDLDAIKMVADISQKEEQLQISRKNAESARATAMASAGLQRLKTDTLVFDNFMRQKGFRTLDEVRKELDSYKQSFIKSQLAIAKASVTPYSADKIISEANKMFNAEAPNLINRAVGNTMKTDDKGNVIPYTRQELMQRLAPLGATKPAGSSGQTYNRADGSSFSVAR